MKRAIVIPRWRGSGASALKPEPLRGDVPLADVRKARARLEKQAQLDAPHALVDEVRVDGVIEEEAGHVLREELLELAVEVEPACLIGGEAGRLGAGGSSPPPRPKKSA